MKETLSLIVCFALYITLDNCLAQDVNSNVSKSIMQQMHDNTQWGAMATNGVQIGVAIYLKNSDGPKKFVAETFLYDESNDWVGLFPPQGYRINIKLFDDKGSAVALTRDGNKSCKVIDKGIDLEMNVKHSFKECNMLGKQTVTPFEREFNILNCFKVENPGKYTLVLSGTIYDLSIGNTHRVFLPPVSVKMPIRQVDLDDFHKRESGLF